ncbi:hypothetical protein [Streptomyces sp. BE230]|uniref:hypothetical protein n=1 Tax=Streptomyces sp. BE230 TaxID=3002526 RepID=UPI002ED211BA|nr:hypothetical protein [Streptomyces sp. BE230]
MARATLPRSAPPVPAPGTAIHLMIWSTTLAHDERDRHDDHPQAPWWWGIGPIGAALLIVIGIAWVLWEFVRSGAGHDPVIGYQGGKIVAIGLVLLGTAVLERFRSRRSPTHGPDAD